MASGVAVIGAVFYTRLGVTRASSVPAMEAAMAINAAVVLASAGLTLLLPRRPTDHAFHSGIRMPFTPDADARPPRLPAGAVRTG